MGFTWFYMFLLVKSTFFLLRWGVVGWSVVGCGGVGRANNVPGQEVLDVITSIIHLSIYVTMLW